MCGPCRRGILQRVKRNLYMHILCKFSRKMDFSNISSGKYMDFMLLTSIWLAYDLPLNCLRLATDLNLTNLILSFDPA